METLINERFEVKNAIGRGAYSIVHRGLDIKKHRSVAIKFSNESSFRTLQQESRLVTKVLKHTKGVPQIYWQGEVHGQWAIVMNLLGPSLSDLLPLCDNRFSLKTVIGICVQMLRVFKAIHTKGVIHRDIKPNNITIGTATDANKLYLIDFGLSAHLTEEVEKDEKDNTFFGTLLYASVRAHRGFRQSYRDDLESLVYVLILLYSGSLPWQYVHEQSEAAAHMVYNLKKMLSISSICGELPSEFGYMLQYARNLSADQLPDYSMLKAKFKQLANRIGISQYGMFDWSKESILRKITGGMSDLDLGSHKKKRRYLRAKIFKSACDLQVDPPNETEAETQDLFSDEVNVFRKQRRSKTHRMKKTLELDNGPEVTPSVRQYLQMRTVSEKAADS